MWLAALLAAGCSGNGTRGAPPPPPPITARDAGPAETPDASSDAGPLATSAPRQGVCATDDGVARAYKEATGRQLDGRHRCIHRARRFEGVVLVGGFAHDRGCRRLGVFVDCTLVDRVDPVQALDRAGWRQAGPALRAELAMDYIQEIELRWQGSISDEPDGPKVANRPDGGVAVTAWIAPPSGRRRERTMELVEYSFSPAGQVSSRVLKTITR